MVQNRENLSPLWRNLERTAQGILLPDGKRNFYGVTIHHPFPEKLSLFMAAVEIESSKAIPPTLAVQTIPSGSYIRFVHKGANAAISLTLDYIYHTWLPKSDVRLAYPIEIEHFGDVVAPDNNRAIYIPIAKINRNSAKTTR